MGMPVHAMPLHMKAALVKAALARYCEPNEAIRSAACARRIACKEFWGTRDSGYTAPLAYECRGSSVTSSARALNLALGHAHVNAGLQFPI